MRSFHRSASPLFLVLAAAFGPLAGCPAGTNDTDDETTGEATTGASTGSPTTSGATTDLTSGSTGTTAEPTSDGTTGDPSGTTADPTGESTETSTGGETGTTGEEAAKCSCIDPGETAGAAVICGSKCGTITDDDEAQLDCVIDSLIAGEGNVKWLASYDMGFSEYGGFLEMFPDRKGLTYEWSRVDLGIEWSNAGFVTIKPASYFEGCKEELTFVAKYDCALDWSDEEPDATCGPAGFATDF